MSFQQAISGLNATSRNLDVIGNNIANASTVGAKASRTEFADMYSVALNGAATKQAGVGVAVASVAQIFSQGTITTTANALDVAIAGNGFFQVKTGDNAVHYTRNGQFKLDRSGYIINNQGHKLMGYAADAAGIVQTGQARELQLSTDTIEPNPTSRVTIHANLDSRGKITEPSGGGIDFTDVNTYNSATSVTAIDANGKDVALTMYFQKTAAETWNVFASANGEPVGGTPLAPIQVITFEESGRLASPTTPFTADIAAGTPVDGVGTMPIDDLQFDFTSFTQFAAPFGVTKLDQDGYTAGSLSGVVVENNGLIRANYTNGRSRSVGQIELATFSNLNGLQPIGGNEWTKSIDSGDPVLGAPGSGNLGNLQTSALEESNVDLTQELVNMMIAQRTYQANAQTIKTQDQVLQTLVNMR